MKSRRTTDVHSTTTLKHILPKGFTRLANKWTKTKKTTRKKIVNKYCDYCREKLPQITMSGWKHRSKFCLRCQTSGIAYKKKNQNETQPNILKVRMV